MSSTSSHFTLLIIPWFGALIPEPVNSLKCVQFVVGQAQINLP